MSARRGRGWRTMNRSPHRQVANIRPRWLRNFLFWFITAPIILSILFFPIVALVWIAALIKNKLFNKEK